MVESKATKAATRDYQSLSSSPWTLMDTLYDRRSHRKYVSTDLGGDFAAELEAFLDLACEARGAGRDSIAALTDPDTVRVVKKAANKGIAGKINMWLPRMPLAGVLVIDLPSSDVRSERPVELPKTVLAVEDAVLWLTERRLGTCWLAGVNGREIIKVAGLQSERSVPAIISFGKPALGIPSAASISGVSYRMMSRRRKPLSKIACSEDAASPYVAESLTSEAFAARSEDVAGLLELMRSGGEKPEGRASIGLALDACLEAGRVAPSGNNAQAWQFVVVKQGEKLSRLQGLSGGGASGAWQAAIVAAGQDRKFESMLLDKPFWDIDVPIAMSHMSLAAVSAGYEAEVLTDDVDEPAIRRLTGLSDGMRIVGVIGLT